MNEISMFSETVLLDGERGLRVEPATVVVRGSTITAVTKGRVRGAIDFGPQLLAPAFVNAHTHLSMSCFRGIGGLASMRGNVVEDLYFVLERDLRAGDVEPFVTIAAAESLLAGVGTVWDHYYFGEEIARACATAGLSAVIAPTLQDVEGPGVGQLERQLEATLSINADPDLAAVGIVAALGPHATDTVSEKLWNRIATLAERHALPLHFHAAQSVEEYRRSMERSGVSPIRWVTKEGWLDSAPTALLVHALYADRDEIAALDPARVCFGYCPASQMQYCFPAALSRWLAEGASVVVGTDCGACNDTMNVQQELRLASGGPLYGVTESEVFGAFWKGGSAEPVAARREAIQAQSERSTRELLSMVLRRPGTLHPRLRVGAIEAGFRANLVIYNLRHPSFWPGRDILHALAYQDVAPAITRMMMSGKWLSEAGDHQRSICSADWLLDARERADVRLQRLLR